MSKALKVNTTLAALNLASVQQQDKCQTMAQQQRHKTGNKISVQGTRALSEALKANTTLVSLILEGVQQQRDNAK